MMKPNLNKELDELFYALTHKFSSLRELQEFAEKHPTMRLAELMDLLSYPEAFNVQNQ